MAKDEKREEVEVVTQRGLKKQLNKQKHIYLGTRVRHSMQSLENRNSARPNKSVSH